jgi:hypothetical protein
MILEILVRVAMGQCAWRHHFIFPIEPFILTIQAYRWAQMRFCPKVWTLDETGRV